MKEMKKLTKDMEEAMEKANFCGSLIRRPGGYWTGENVKMDDHGVPEWYIIGLTINALIRRKLLIPTRFLTRGQAYYVIVNKDLP